MTGAPPRVAPDFLFSQGVPAPCFVLDEARLDENAAVLDSVQKRTGARILLALKAFSAWALFPRLSRALRGPLWGTCASSVDEARLGREEFGGEVHAFAAAFDEADMRELLGLADHITFNSLAQWRRFAPMIAEHAARTGRPPVCGLRINPEHSEGAAAIYDPCSPGSRLGIRPADFDGHVFEEGITGLHMHTLCEQGADALARTLAACRRKFAPHLARCRWMNLGGGHHITRAGYDRELLCKSLEEWRAAFGLETLYLEPGEAVALEAGWLTATVLDIVRADMPVAVLDVSAACHMPDVLEMPYRPNVFCECGKGIAMAGGAEDAAPGDWKCRLAGKSCLAGDVIGEYAFPAPLKTGQRLVFGDMAIYSMVKTTTFNGLRLPSIGAFRGRNFRMLRTFGYEDFKTRLS